MANTKPLLQTEAVKRTRGIRDRKRAGNDRVHHVTVQRGHGMQRGPPVTTSCLPFASRKRAHFPAPSVPSSPPPPLTSQWTRNRDASFRWGDESDKRSFAIKKKLIKTKRQEVVVTQYEQVIEGSIGTARSLAPSSTATLTVVSSYTKFSFLKVIPSWRNGQTAVRTAILLNGKKKT